MELITISEFCFRYRISPRTVWTWVKKGRLLALRDAAGRVRQLIDPHWPILDQSDDPDIVMSLAVLKPGQVAALLGVHPATIRKFVQEGRLKAVQVGSQRRFSLAAVRHLIAERALGHKPRNRREASQGMIRWARWKLHLPVDDQAS